MKVRQWLIYIRRSYKGADSADVSEEQQETAARAVIPDGERVTIITDSGGHQSGASADRHGYQQLLSLVASGVVAGIAVYDLSRLARNASLMLPLRDELEKRQIPIRVATMPTSQWDGAAGRFVFGQLCLSAQYQRDLDSERMIGINRTTFEAGGHRGADPFGYRTIRAPDGTVQKPRTLRVVEHEAELVRRIWRDVATKSMDQIAGDLQREGVSRRVNSPWTREAVRDIIRRGRFYLGYAVAGRGVEERPGRHAPILDEATWAAGRAALDGRLSGRVRRSPKKRTYLLSGLITCECGANLRGQTSSSRETEWRYYICRHCDSPSVLGAEADAAVLDRLRSMTLPPEAVEAAREELRRRLGRGPSGAAEEAHRRLETRLERLRTQFEWGDVSEAEYRAKMDDTRAQLALLPEPERVVTFDAVAEIVESLQVAITAASPAQVKELLLLLVERVTTRDRAVDDIVLKPAALPFFAEQPDLACAPPEGIEPPTQALGRPRSVR